jgi:hypothetical protein
MKKHFTSLAIATLLAIGPVVPGHAEDAATPAAPAATSTDAPPPSVPRPSLVPKVAEPAPAAEAEPTPNHIGVTLTAITDTAIIAPPIGSHSRFSGRTSITIASTGTGSPGSSISDAGLSARDLRLVEDIPDLGGQHRLGQGLLQQRHAGIEPALMHDGVAGIAGHEEHPETRLAV